jgi:protoporphyrinogen oxidase
MKSEQVHSLILGAGPSGLAAGYTLAKAGLKPVVLEKDKVPGGLMRSIRHGDYILDIGRKELYNRLARVDEFWGEILGSDYRTYPHRGGILYDGRIIDMSPAYLGFRRGMPWGMFLSCCFDFVWWRVNPAVGKAKNLQEYWYQQRGRRLTQIANQGFQEKLAGRKWVEVPMPEDAKNGHGTSFFGTVKQAMIRAFSAKETNTYKGIWRHPAKGTGQICEALAQGIVQAGGRIHYEAKIMEITNAQGKIDSVTAEIGSGSERVVFQPMNLISSAPAEFLEKQILHRDPGANGAKTSATRPRTVILVYLFADEEPRFPHFWLQVTCPTTRIGRIANYAALNAELVPKGKTCLCCEIYSFGEDPLLALSNEEIAQQALEDCSRSGLITREKCFEKFVLRFPGADASQNRHNWLNQNRERLLKELRQFSNLYSVNRTDLDISTLAGIEAAEAIISGDRTQFDLHIDPVLLGIRSASKPLEFRNPPGVQV